MIGPIRIDPPAILASLAGYTDLPYRLLCRTLGAPFCATEMMLDRQLLLPGRLRNRLIHTDPADHPVSGQIIGNDPAVMAKAAIEMGMWALEAERAGQPLSTLLGGIGWTGVAQLADFDFGVVLDALDVVAHHGASFFAVGLAEHDQSDFHFADTDRWVGAGLRPAPTFEKSGTKDAGRWRRSDHPKRAGETPFDVGTGGVPG